MIDDEDLSECSRCEAMVGTETLVRRLNWSICENCWDEV